MKAPEINGLSMVKKLGEGAQGEVWQVRMNGTDYALKLYNEGSSTEEQRTIIRNLVEAGLPSPRCAGHFTWPLKYVEMTEEKRFGYLMQMIDTSQYISFSQVEAGIVQHPGFGVMVESCRQLAEYFRELHIAGLCYQDVSKNNFMFSPKTGDVIICDTDNIVINQSGLGNVQGTPTYVAPEIVLGQAKPSTDTDHHSLAVLLFILMCGNNPLHGLKEFNIRIMDGVAAEYLYGREPVFVFDPVDKSNRLPDAPGYRHVASYWKIMPNHIKNLFTKALTAGLRNPSQRITAIEWVSAFTKLQGLRHVCSCGAENFWDPDRQDQQLCWNRGCSVAFPQKLYIKGRSTSSLLVKPGQLLTTMHLGEKSTSTTIGAMEPHPSDASLVLLRNKTGETWCALLGKQQVKIPEGRAIPLHPGLIINAAEHEIMVYP